MENQELEPGTQEGQEDVTAANEEKVIDLESMTGKELHELGPEKILGMDLEPDVEAHHINRLTDYRVKSATRKAKEDGLKLAEQRAEAARKEAEEAKLVENKEFETLAQKREEEVKLLREQIERYERSKNVDKLLDAMEVEDNRMRKFFHSIECDLKELDTHVKGYNEIVSEIVEAKVNERISTADISPPKGKPNEGQPRYEDIKDSPAKKAAFIGEYGEEAFQKMANAFYKKQAAKPKENLDKNRRF